MTHRSSRNGKDVERPDEIAVLSISYSLADYATELIYSTVSFKRKPLVSVFL